MKHAARLCLLFLLWPVMASAQDAGIISPLVTTAPVIDGKLGDPAWPAQPQIANFAVASQFTPSPKAIQGFACHDGQALYLAFRVAEPQPALLKRGAADGSRDVWKDDSLEIFIRTGDSSLDFDQFIVNSAGSRQGERCRGGAYDQSWRPQWLAAGTVGADFWSVEVAIPFAVLGIPPPTPGTMIQLGVGREDYTKTGPQLVNWPAGVGYGGMGGYGRLFFVSDNLLANPDFSQQQDGKVAAWGFGDKGEDSQFFSAAQDQGRAVIRFRSPGQYSVAQQGLRLKPNAAYRLQVEVRGTAGCYLRARTAKRRGDQTTPYDIYTKPAADYRPYSVTFPTGETGEALIIIGGTESTGVGEAFLRNLSITQDVSLASDGPAIAVAGGKLTVIRKLLVSDCRALRGFVTSPVDGRLNSYNWNMDSWEYNQRGAGAGVGYGYHEGDGLHITLADQGGVDAVQIRQGARVKLYAGADRYDDPGRAPLVWEFAGKSRNSRALFPKRVMSDRFSFFELTDGLIADCTFLRVSTEAPKGKAGALLSVGGAATAGPVQAAAEARFPEADHTWRGLVAGAGEPFTPPDKHALHLIAPPFATETSLDALGLQIKTQSQLVRCPLTVAIQDPLNPLHELMSADCELADGDQFSLVCDFPDQVIPAGKPLWLTLTFGAPVRIERLSVQPYELSRMQATPEALAYRKLLMRGLFCQLSEARQWGLIRKNTEVEKFYAENRWGPGIRELHGFIAYCKDLAPEDDLVRVYDEWVWRSARDLPAWEVKLDRVPGAPEWAVLLRQSWLASRAVCQWWLDHRLVPSGEFGGLVGDDSDLYQNFADLPMLETGGTAAAVRTAAANLAELAEKENLENGLNKHTMDPLHAYEEGVNHESLMLWWNYGDPVYFERCLLAAKSLPATTVMTEKGHRHFKSQMIGAEDLRIDRPVDLDGGAHPLMWHPALEVAWYNGSPAVLKYLDEWATGWAAHDEPGKYAISVDVKTDTTKDTHYRPLYGGYSAQASTRVWLYFLTGQERYIEPFKYYFEKGEMQLPMHGFIPELYHRGFLDDLPNKDLWVEKHAVVAAAAGKKQALVDALKVDLTELQRFGWMSTGAEVFTDRVFLYGLTNAAIAYTGGYAARNKFNHTHAVSWEGFGTDYAALVLQARPDHFKALVYNFADKPVTGSFRLWLLDHGRYKLAQGLDGNGDDQADQAGGEKTVEVGRATALPLTLPPKQVTVLELMLTDKLDDLTQRPDLALSPLEVKADGKTVRGIVHNIGGGDAPQFTVALVDAAGKQQVTLTLGPLAAPLDLSPRRIEFSFPLKSANVRGWRVVVDPQGKLPETYEGNNAVTL
jgi:hypothetical protein